MTNDIAKRTNSVPDKSFCPASKIQTKSQPQPIKLSPLLKYAHHLQM